MNWYYWRGGARTGPVSASELKRLAQIGVVLPSTKVEDENGRQAVAERVAGLFAAAVSNVGDAQTSAALETRLRELTERLERLETRLAEAEKTAAEASATFRTLRTRLGDWDAALAAVVEKIDALTERAAATERRRAEGNGGVSTGAASVLGNGASGGAFELSAGTFYVGTDFPPGRYRAEIRRGYASVAAETPDDYQGYFLDVDPDPSSYNPSCILELRSGAKLKLDKPVEFTYLGALR